MFHGANVGHRFQRLWVVQEVSLASKALIFCGPACIPWSLLSRFLDGYIHEKSSAAISSSVSSTSLKKIRPPVSNIYLMLENEESPTLLDLLVTSRSCQCSDPRDKVYALFSLLDQSQIPCEPDYAQSYEDVFTNTATWIIKETQDLRILNYIQPQQNTQLPSWVPDWACPDYTPWSELPDVRSVEDFRSARAEAMDKRFAIGNPWTMTADSDAYEIEKSESFELRFSPPSVHFATDSAITVPVLRIFARKVGTVWIRKQVEIEELKHSLHPDCGCQQEDFGEEVRQWFWSICPFFQPFHRSPIPQIFRDELRLHSIDRPLFLSLQHLVMGAALYSHELRGYLTETSIGFGPMDMLDGDGIWRLDGINKWFVLRRRGDKYRIIGPCYFQGGDTTIEVCPYCKEAIQRPAWEEIEIL
jgi:hypothetical protein